MMICLLVLTEDCLIFLFWKRCQLWRFNNFRRDRYGYGCKSANQANKNGQSGKEVSLDGRYLAVDRGIINYLDRANLSIAAPQMMKDLGLTATDIGLLGTVFSWSYALMQLPAGWLIDRFGTKKCMPGLDLVERSDHADRRSIQDGLVHFRPRAARCRWSTVLSDDGKDHVLLVSEKGTRAGNRHMGLLLQVGPCYCTAFARIYHGYVWLESPFYITGVLGIIFAIGFYVFYKNPDQSRKLTKQELDYIQSDGAGSEQSIQTSKIKWRELFKYRSVWGMILGFFCTIWIWNIFLVFLPCSWRTFMVLH